MNRLGEVEGQSEELHHPSLTSEGSADPET